MSVEIPEALLELPANSGIFAIWMIFHHYGVDLEIADLVKLCEHDAEDGAYGISLAVALKKLGLDVIFTTDYDPEPQPLEVKHYREAEVLKIEIQPAYRYQQLKQHFEEGRFIIVFYDTLEQIGQHSLVYSMDEKEVCFFDSFDPMSAQLFEQQRQQEGICRQAIIIDDRNFVMREA